MAWKPLNESVWSEVPRHPDPENDLGYSANDLHTIVFEQAENLAVMPDDGRFLADEEFIVADINSAVVDLSEMR